MAKYLEETTDGENEWVQDIDNHIYLLYYDDIREEEEEEEQWQ